MNVPACFSSHTSSCDGERITIIRGKTFHVDLRRFGARSGVSLPETTARRNCLEPFRLLSCHRSGREQLPGSRKPEPLLFLSQPGAMFRRFCSLPKPSTHSPKSLQRGKPREHNFFEKWALVASGDLSHCLSPEAPGGFTPQAAIHDQAAQNALEMSSPAPLFALSTSQVEQAGECGLRSLLVFLGLARGEPIHTLSYEAPFGVGYCTAFWHGKRHEWGDESRTSPDMRYAPLRSFGTKQIEAYVMHKKLLSAEEALLLCADSAIWNPRRACFVPSRQRRDICGVYRLHTSSRSTLAKSFSQRRGRRLRDPRFPTDRGRVAAYRVSLDIISSQAGPV
jgi:hypothetical protein